MPDESSPLRYLNGVERPVLGWLVARMFASKSARFERSLAEIGEEASARMACVNALRAYAIGCFLLGLLGDLVRSRPVFYPFMGIALLCMVWSCWCLYTTVAPEREFKRTSTPSLEDFAASEQMPAPPVG